MASPPARFRFHVHPQQTLPCDILSQAGNAMMQRVNRHPFRQKPCNASHFTHCTARRKC